MPKSPENKSGSWGTRSSGEVPHQLPQEHTRATSRWQAWMERQLAQFESLVRPVRRRPIEEKVAELRESAPTQLVVSAERSLPAEVPVLSSREQEVTREVEQKIAFFSQAKPAVLKLARDLSDLLVCNQDEKRQHSNRLLEQARLLIVRIRNQNQRTALVRLYSAYKLGDTQQQYHFLSEVGDTLDGEFLQPFFVFLRVGTPQLVADSVLERYYTARIGAGASWSVAKPASEHFADTRPH